MKMKDSEQQTQSVWSWIGLYGPMMLFITTLIILRNKPTWLLAYIIGYLSNNILNIVLKLLFKQPRPDEDLAVFYATQNKGWIQYNRYGMPSGHAQRALFSTIYIWFATKNYWITLLYLLISCISIYQKLNFSSHDILQITVGAIIGGLVAYITVIYVKHLLPGILRLKPDDNAPI